LHDTNDDKSDDARKRFNDVSDQFCKYHTKILLGNFKENVVREDIVNFQSRV